MSERAVHHGRNIKRIREIQGIKQEALALELGEDWSQKKISLLEGKEVVDDVLLGEVAKALNVTSDAIKNFDDEKTIYNISCNFSDNAVNNNAVNIQNINPVDKWLDALEENKKLYERLLQSEREKVALLEKLLEQKK
ncbi:MAG: XRE family transcriptional regulator [Gammaproteobacteria bacterium]|nr:MAG: XRE family transcriptional regulator [Gammaproteobacteria bacterium]